MPGSNLHTSGSYPPMNIVQTAFLPPIGSGPMSSGDHSSHFHSHYGGTTGEAIPMHHHQLSTAIIHTPKRPYRQRRKDPSCDACRERKVKCDATETTSCTECSSRNVRCQFTKDTNRRMSSIKQVQDLERQLLDTKQQLDRFRNSETRAELSSTLSQTSSEGYAEPPVLGKSPRRMLKAKTPHDLVSARMHLSNIGRGLLKPPVLPSTEQHHQTIQISEQHLPPRQQAERLIRSYLEYVHRHFPVLYWPDFHRSFCECYDARESVSVDKSFLCLLFAIFACGSLHTDETGVEKSAADFAEQTMTLFNAWEDNNTAAEAVTAFLISMYWYETNRKSAAWVWAGSAIRIIQDKGYHVQGGQWSVAEGEMRKRIWYSFYVWDRILSMELGKPMLIDDDEFDTEYPDTLEEENDGSEDGLGVLQPTLLLAAIHVSRLMSSLSKLFRSLCITYQTIHKFEAQLYSCLHLLPRPLQLSTSTPLDLLHLRPIIYFQNTRLLLHRHNMSPACSVEQRSQAISQCVYIAQDTATTISRTMERLDVQRWSEQLKCSVNTILCTHLWRCMLFLVFRRMFDPFMVLCKAATTIGDRKLINISCGRYLRFFTELLIQRIDNGKVNELEQDEELLVYLSGDLQAGTGSWVWGNAETGTLLSRRQKHGRPRHTSQERDSASPADGLLSWNTQLTSEEKNSWGGWEQVEHVVHRLRRLEEGLEPRRAQPVNLQLPPISQTHGAASFEPGAGTSSVSPTESSRSRMNIASII